MTTARATIGVPVYNGEEYLGQTLESLLAQTYGDFRILIGDNASTDGTAEIARRFAERDSRVEYVRQPSNLGAAVNYNRLFRMTETEYFRWSAADDLSAPNMLELCVAELDRRPDVVLAYPRVVLMDSTGEALEPYEEGLHLQAERPGERFLRFLEQVRLCNALYGLLRTSAVKRTRLIGSFRGSDIVFQAELALYGKFSELSGTVFYRRIHSRAFHHLSIADQRTFYSPGQAQGAEFRLWRHLREHLRSLATAPIGVRERLRSVRGLLRHAFASRGDYVEEVRAGIRGTAARRAGGPGPTDSR